MQNEMQHTQSESDVAQVKKDLKSLYDHLGIIVGKKTAETRQKWEETRAILEAKQKALEERTSQLVAAGTAASGEMRSGFSAALTELKKAFAEAKAKFEGE